MCYSVLAKIQSTVPGIFFCKHDYTNKNDNVDCITEIQYVFERQVPLQESGTESESGMHLYCKSLIGL